MTAPGNDALLITALAAFAACLGYAAGRLHQWYRTVLDRDEAYRDGYDTATRSVFSTAARLIGGRRAVRGTAVVTPPAGDGARPQQADPPGVAVAGRPGAPTGGPSGPPVSRSAGSAGGPGASGSSVSRSVGSPGLSSSSSVSSSSSAGEGAASSADSAVSGDPAVSGDSAEAADAAGGRHYVPDELVQAPTYRLTPDRVARAKVRQAIPEDDESQETTRLPSVPRPRAH